jgi:hypothetical protein
MIGRKKEEGIIARSQALPGDADPEALPPVSLKRGRASGYRFLGSAWEPVQSVQLFSTLPAANNPKVDRPNRPESTQLQHQANFPNSDKQNNAVPSAA